MNMQDVEIVAADAKARRLAIVLMLAVAALGGVLVVGARLRLDEAARVGATDPGQAGDMIGGLVAALGIANALVSSVFAAWAGRLGWRVLREGRWPPRGMRVVRDTVVRRGGMAVAAAVGLFCLAALALSGNLGTLALYVLVRRLGQGG